MEKKLDKKEAMLWLTIIRLAQSGDESSIQELKEANKARAEAGLGTIEEELISMLTKEK